MRRKCCREVRPAPPDGFIKEYRCRSWATADGVFLQCGGGPGHYEIASADELHAAWPGGLGLSVPHTPTSNGCWAWVGDGDVARPWHMGEFQS